MIKTEFGIIQQFDPNKCYDKYEPQKYSCVVVDDEYIDDWWSQLLDIPTYNMTITKPQTALSRWGITLIPPSSLPKFLLIVESDRRIFADTNLQALAQTIRSAIQNNKYMIH